jgi:hypothetical protein
MQSFRPSKANFLWYNEDEEETEEDETDEVVEIIKVDEE